MLGKLEYGSITHNKLKFRLDIIYITVIFTLMKMQRIEQENYSLCKTNEAEILLIFKSIKYYGEKKLGGYRYFQKKEIVNILLHVLVMKSMCLFIIVLQYYNDNLSSLQSS